MVKFVGLIRLKPGYDPDETWKMWREKHSVWGKSLLHPELKEYHINRVISTIGESTVYGFSEMLFDDVESCKRAFDRVLKAPPDDVLPRFQIERLILEYEQVPLD
jgi:uncharacterized protein (TIGR02118 family)